MKTTCQEREPGAVASRELTVWKLKFVIKVGDVLTVAATARWQRAG